MNTVIALLSFFGISSFIFFSLRDEKAYKMDLMVREARDQHAKTAFDHGVFPRNLP